MARRGRTGPGPSRHMSAAARPSFDLHVELLGNLFIVAGRRGVALLGIVGANCPRRLCGSMEGVKAILRLKLGAAADIAVAEAADAVAFIVDHADHRHAVL